jgi:uncharacterized membrane protein YciS (DUF1049 family)
MQHFVQSTFQFGFSETEVKLSTTLAYVVAGSLCMGWLALLSFSLASMLNPAL